MVRSLVPDLRQIGLQLADIQERTGIRRSVLSRLENDLTLNLTMTTLQRYAVALGIGLRAPLTQVSTEGREESRESQ